MELAYALAWGDSVSRAEANAALDTAGAEVLLHASFTLLGSGDLAEQVLPVARLSRTSETHWTIGSGASRILKRHTSSGDGFGRLETSLKRGRERSPSE